MMGSILSSYGPSTAIRLDRVNKLLSETKRAEAHKTQELHNSHDYIALPSRPAKGDAGPHGHSGCVALWVKSMSGRLAYYVEARVESCRKASVALT